MTGAILQRAKAYEAVVVAELREIDKDTKYLQTCQQKYGDIMNGPIEHLQREFEARKVLLKLLHKTVTLIKDSPLRAQEIWAKFETASKELY
ncbi:Hypothetical protein GLP15_3218 [Giardia lamblia P15]|uniref:Uncharacterized protein n=1 Tax=Giardia intestinalis (strain P15) TaxID=658858 RepID=E1EWT2_GIAIA|nr:Hypothetical protein GLP15_3218 [Giardia lamblia P15]